MVSPFRSTKNNSMFLIDISHHQDGINFAELKASINPRIDAVIIKATEGSNYVDSKLMFNSFQAKKVGFPIGYYHFGTLNSKEVTKDAEQEAIFFLDTVHKAGPHDLPLVLDIETNKAALSKIEVLAWIKQFFFTLKDHGKENYVIYSSASFLNDNLPDGHGLGNIPLWVAHYTSKPSPAIPHGWSDYWLWQFSQTGRVPGIKGNVDLNRSIKPLF